MSIEPSQYSMIAASFNLIQSDTARWSDPDRYPEIKLGVGRTPNTAVCDGSIRSPCRKATLTRTSCRALPRSLTHTTIGKPVVLGRKFAIRKKSVSGSSIDTVTDLANRAYTLAQAQLCHKPKTALLGAGSGANGPLYHHARPTLVHPFRYNSN